MPTIINCLQHARAIVVDVFLLSETGEAVSHTKVKVFIYCVRTIFAELRFYFYSAGLCTVSDRPYHVHKMHMHTYMYFMCVSNQHACLICGLHACMGCCSIFMPLRATKGCQAGLTGQTWPDLSGRTSGMSGRTTPPHCANTCI